MRDWIFALVSLALILGIAFDFSNSGPISTWYACRQLAPIERAFVRGC